MAHQIENLPYLKADEYDELLKRRQYRCDRCGRIEGLSFKEGDRWRTAHLHVIYRDGDERNHTDKNLALLCSGCVEKEMTSLLKCYFSSEPPREPKQLNLF